MPCASPSYQQFLRPLLVRLAALLIAAVPLLAGAAPTGSFPRDFLPIGDLTLMVANRPVEGTDFAELWRTDGTAAGTFRLVVCPASCNPRVETVAASETLGFFTAWGADLRWQVWATDGTQAGTRRLTDFLSVGFAPGGVGFLWAEEPGRLFFLAELTEGWTLWSSDGTAAGTRRLATFPSGVVQRPYGLVEQDGLAWFIVVEEHPTELPWDPQRFEYTLWTSDGSVRRNAGGRDPAGRGAAPPARRPGDLAGRRPRALPRPQDERRQPALGVGRYRERAQGPFAGYSGFLDSNTLFFARQGGVYFWADDLEHGRQLYRTDGTAAGTVRLTDLPYGNVVSGFLDPLAWQDGILFAVDEISRRAPASGSATGRRPAPGD